MNINLGIDTELEENEAYYNGSTAAIMAGQPQQADTDLLLGLGTESTTIVNRNPCYDITTQHTEAADDHHYDRTFESRNQPIDQNYYSYEHLS